MVILGNFGEQTRKTLSCPSNQSRVDIQSKLSIDSEARKARLGSQPTYGPSSRSFTILPIADFNLIFMCSTIVLGNTRFHTLYFTQQNISTVFSSLERRSKIPSENCIETPAFYSILFMQFIQIIVMSYLIMSE